MNLLMKIKMIIWNKMIQIVNIFKLKIIIIICYKKIYLKKKLKEKK